MSPRLSAFLRVFIVCFLTGWLGRIFAPESTWSLAVLGFGFAGILVVEAPHYARADAAFLRSLRDAESAEIPVVEVGS